MKRLIVILFLLISCNLFATDKYFKSGGDNNWANAANWYTDSTYVTTTTVPGTGDNAYFTYAAGAITCNVNLTSNCRNLDMHGFRGTFSGFNGLSIYGNIYYSSGATYTWSGTCSMNGSSGTYTLNPNGKTINNLTISMGAGGTSQLAGALTTANNITLTSGTFDTYGYNITCGNNFVLGVGTKTLTCSSGTSDITIATGTTGFDFVTNGTNFTSSGNINFHVQTNNASFLGNGKTYYGVYFDGANKSNTITGNNSIGTLSISAGNTLTLSGTTQTITTAFSATGLYNSRITLTGTAWTLSKSSGTVNVDYCNIDHSTASGGATFNVGAGSYNGGSNSGWTGWTTKKYYFVTGNGNGNFNDHNNWYSDTTHATHVAYPMSTDTAYLGTHSGTGTCTINSAAVVKSLDMHGFAGTLSNGGNGLTYYGNIYLAGTISFVTSGSLFFQGTTSVTFTSNGKTLGAGFAFILNGSAGTVILQDNFGTGDKIQLNSGTLDLNGKNVQCSYMTLQAGTKTLTTTGGTSTLTSTGNSGFDFATNGTNFTVSGNIVFVCNYSTGNIFYGNGKTYYELDMYGSIPSITGNNTFTNLKIKPSSSSSVATLTLSASSTQTVTGQLTLYGRTKVYRLQVVSSTLGTPTNITNNGAAPILFETDFRDCTLTGSGGWTGGYHIGDALGNNVPANTFDAARILVWRKSGGTGSWSDTTSWEEQSNPGVKVKIPLPQDSVIFDASSITAGSKTITADCLTLGKGIDFSGIANSPTFAVNGTGGYIDIYGSLYLSGVSLGGSVSYYRFYGRSSACKITTNGITIIREFDFYNQSGTYTIMDNLTINNSNLVQYNGALTLASGITVTASVYSAASSAAGSSLNLGNNTTFIITRTSAYTAWTVAGSISVNCGTSTIKIAGNPSGGSINFNGGGRTYYNLWFSGATSLTNCYTILGSNTITNELKLVPTTPAAAYIKFTDATTQTIGTLTATGTAGNLITMTGTGTTGWTLSSATNQFCNYLNLSYSTITGGQTYCAGANSTDGGGNINWGFGNPCFGLRSYYQLNDTVTDASGFGHSGTGHGTTYVKGMVQDALSCNGTSTYIDFGTWLNGGTCPITLTFWYNTTSTAAEKFVFDKTSTGLPYPIEVSVKNYVQWQTGNGRFTYNAMKSNNQSLVSNKWYFVSLVGTLTNKYLYINEKLDNSGAYFGGIEKDATKTLYIGARSDGSNKFSGLIDDVKLYNTALPSSTLRNIYFERKGVMQ